MRAVSYLLLHFSSVVIYCLWFKSNLFFFFNIWINCVLAYGVFKEWEGTGIEVFDWSKWNKCSIFVYVA